MATLFTRPDFDFEAEISVQNSSYVQIKLLSRAV